ncbi:phosphoserine phosphatase SerB [Pararhizobium mangrovi]|uniref:Phosphoserine phosphatase n=1 Tax=Pararhizobium mangrovi TaxID=2590452 RepID=A0A506UHX7_9HYPH|nr:phosphoserine phosphatase SerB [Pararhizobium mangrovi]TPW32909.1 phosphoserine phosphatase SerB [Pararhizobium mangrovi]
MALVATLIANPSNPLLTEEVAATAAATVSAKDRRWLAEGVALDLELDSDAGAPQVREALQNALGDLAVDVVVQPGDARRKRFLLADMDSTMIGQECIDELADEIGVRDRVSAITARAMNGEIAFEPALRERVGLLKGLPVSVVARVLQTRITLAPGGRELVQTMRANGAYTALVSGGFTLFSGPIAERIGFDEHRANRLIVADDVLTGEVAEPILGRQAKIDTLDDIVARHGLSHEDAIVVGDGANDLGMIERAGTGVALHAKPSVAEAAPVRIDHGDLTALLYLQGYSRADFAE